MENDFDNFQSVFQSRDRKLSFIRCKHDFNLTLIIFEGALEIVGNTSMVNYETYVTYCIIKLLRNLIPPEKLRISTSAPADAYNRKRNSSSGSSNMQTLGKLYKL